MTRADVNGEPTLALAFFFFVCAGLFEMVAISQSGALCGKSAAWIMVLVFSVPFLWLGGVVSLYSATRDRGLRGGRWTAVGGVVAIFVGIFILPTLVSSMTGCFS